LNKGAGNVAIEIINASVTEDLHVLKDMKIEIPIGKWNLAVKHVHSDRKLLGGLLLDFANNKERVSAVVGNDRLLAEFRRVLLEATIVLVEEQAVAIVDAKTRNV
jgi:tRNA-binding EMAP/Myf-like protein